MKRDAAVAVLLAAAIFAAACGGGGGGISGSPFETGEEPPESEQAQTAPTARADGSGKASSGDTGADVLDRSGSDGTVGGGQFISDVPLLDADVWAAHVLLWPSDMSREAARSPAVPAEVLRLLAADESLADDVAANPNAPADLLASLAAAASESDHPAGGVRWRVAGHRNTPADVLRSLANDFESGARRALAANPNTPGDVLRLLAADPDIDELVAANPSAPGDLLANLANDPDERPWGLAPIAARNPSLPADTLGSLAGDIVDWLAAGGQPQRYCPEAGAAPAPEAPEGGGDAQPTPRAGVELRNSVAANLSLPAGVLDRMAAHASGQLLGAVAANPGTPAATLRLLVEECTNLYGAASNPSSPAGALAILANSEHYSVREAVAANLGTPGDLLELLAGDPEPDVREAVAKNPGTPGATLEVLADDVSLRGRVADNPSSPEAVRFDLWLQSDPSDLAARYGHLTDRAMARIAERALAGSRSETLIALAAFHPRTPSDALEQLATSPSEAVRAIVASSPTTPGGLLDTLARDNHPDVRRAAAAELARRGN